MTVPDELDRRPLGAVDRRLAVLGPDRLANRAFVGSLALAVAVFVAVGREQWFIRDDWAILLTREKLSDRGDVLDSFFLAQDGHWMTVPIAVYRGTSTVFGLDSYWPFLAVCLAAHVGIVVAVRVLCHRVGVTPWTSTLLCAALLVLGSGWENIVFAVQITYNFSLLAFLVHLLLVDHDGDVGRRDALGAAIGVLGVASSGFGPFFVAGVFLLLVLRRRWSAALVATVPAALAFSVWWLAFGSDAAADEVGRPLTRVPEFMSIGLTAVFEALTPVGTLIGVAMLATTTVLVWRDRDPRAHDVLVTMGATMFVTLLGVGVQRVGFGVETAGSSRYVYIGAMLIAPAFGLAVDQLARLGRPAMLAGWLALAAAAGMQAAQLVVRADEWADRSTEERRQLEVFAGAALPPGFDMTQACLAFSVDVRCDDVPALVTAGAIVPRAPQTDDERAFVERLATGVVTPLTPLPPGAAAP